MRDEPYVICFLTDDLSSEKAEQAINRCLNVGFGLEGNKGIEEVLDAEPLGEKDTITARLQYDNLFRLTVSFNLGNDWAWNSPRLLLRFSTKDVFTQVDMNKTDYERKRIQERVLIILELVRHLAALADPTYGWSFLMIGQSPDSGLRPTDRPISENIDQFGWLTVLDDSLIESFGGREHIRAAPAWSVEELESGHMMIVRTDNPADPTFEPSGSLETHLLDGEGVQEADSDAYEVDDPFGSLSDGDLGADVIIDRALVGNEIENEDLTLVRCRRDGGVLRDVQTGEVIRRIYDDEDTATEELVSGDDEQFSPLLLAGLPVEFVRLESVDEENVVTNVMGLDVDVDKLGLLVQLGTAVRPNVTESDIETVEKLLEQIERLEDVDGIDRLIQSKLF